MSLEMGAARRFFKRRRNKYSAYGLIPAHNRRAARTCRVISPPPKFSAVDF
jgi:hypothetical protein